MTYFQLRKREPEPEPEETVEEAEDGGEEEQPDKQHGPLLTGLSGPGQWLAARFGLGWAWGVHGVGAWAVVFYGGWIAAGIVLVWLLAVGLFTPKEYLNQIANRIERGNGQTEEDVPEEDEEPRPSAPQEVYAATLEWICGQIAYRNGIHLADLLAHAHAHNLHTDLDVPAFRAVLEQWGFPIRQQLKVGGRNRPGIHRDDLPRAPLQDPSPKERASATTSAEYPL